MSRFRRKLNWNWWNIGWNIQGKVVHTFLCPFKMLNFTFANLKNYRSPSVAEAKNGWVISRAKFEVNGRSGQSKRTRPENFRLSYGKLSLLHDDSWGLKVSGHMTETYIVNPLFSKDTPPFIWVSYWEAFGNIESSIFRIP